MYVCICSLYIIDICVQMSYNKSYIYMYMFMHICTNCVPIYAQAGSTALMSHCSFGTAESLKLLIDRGADVNYRDAVCLHDNRDDVGT